MRSWRFGALLIPVLLVQVAFLPAWRPFGVVPALVLVFVVLVGLTGTASLALAGAIAGGLLLDLSSGSDFGLRLGVLVLVALATGMVHRAGLDLTGPAVALLLVASATLLSDVAVLAGLINGTDYWPWSQLVGKFLIEIMLNLGLTIVMRPLVRWAVAPEPGSYS